MPKVVVGNTSVKLKSADITAQCTDAIVNLNNETLNQTVGVSRDILAAGGVDVKAECASLGKLRSDEYALTKPGKLKCKKIIHLINVTSSRIVESVKRALQACDEHRLTTVSLPAFGTGLASLDPQTSIKYIFKGLEEYLNDDSISTGIVEIILVVNRQDVYQGYLKFFQNYQDNEEMEKELPFFLRQVFAKQDRALSIFEKIEKMFLDNKKMEKELPFFFGQRGAKQNRALSIFEKMFLGALLPYVHLVRPTNRKKRERAICAEKILKAAAEENKQAMIIEYPKSWTDIDEKEVQVITLKEGTQEYNEVKNNFLATCGMTPFTLLKMERIQNAPLYKKFSVVKKEVERKNACKKIVRTLYHGTSEHSIKIINEEGFNRSFCKRGVYGKGSYFAVNSEYSCDEMYSKQDKEGKKYIYQTAVITGKYTKGNSELCAPPFISDDPNEGRYDSVTDDIKNPRMFVVFYDFYAYPEYLITFENYKK